VEGVGVDEEGKEMCPYLNSFNSTKGLENPQ